jgi:pimeloyl-ACP methyl ester carboxylesterase
VKITNIAVGSCTIACHESSGKGADVLLVHANSLSAREYQRQLESPLGETHHLVAIDLPGHGQSSNAPDPVTTYTFPGYADVITGVATQLGLEQAIFVGWSLGGCAVLEAAPRLSEAAGFLIFGSSPIGIPAAMDEAFLPHPAMRVISNVELTEAGLTWFLDCVFKPGTVIPDLFKEDVRRTDGQARSNLIRSVQLGKYRDQVNVVAYLRKPLAIVHGEEDQIVNAAYISKLAIPTLWRGELQIIKGAGHAPNWEQPEQFNAVLEEFIEDTRTR